MKNLFYTLILSALIVPAFALVAVGQAEAKTTCSYSYGYNGYSYTSNKCKDKVKAYPFVRHNFYQTNNNAQFANLQAYIQQLMALLEQLQNLQEQQNNYTPFPNNNGNSDVDVTTRSAQDIDDEEATLRGEVDFNKEDEATVYFRYGKTKYALNNSTTHVVLDEDDDDESFSAGIRNLRDDTTYYYRAVAEDERGRRDYGSVLSFETDDDDRNSNDDDEPDVDTDDAEDIEEDSAELHGSVDMNDFRNGTVFFVYGEDESQVKDIDDDYTRYSRIDEDGDDLQKVLVDNDLDREEDYYYDINNLDDDTDIYFSICVEYEDEDDDDVIKCGKVEDFTTDED